MHQVEFIEGWLPIPAQEAARGVTTLVPGINQRWRVLAHSAGGDHYQPRHITQLNTRRSND
ncbi:hypothetical protein [Pseudomonas silensiensis]|uniref:hypothetical protein n=1 Tax=Pseudomonas silensiensis TaxID=2991049 RepID=UPI003D1CD69A